MSRYILCTFTCPLHHLFSALQSQERKRVLALIQPFRGPPQPARRADGDVITGR